MEKGKDASIKCKGKQIWMNRETMALLDLPGRDIFGPCTMKEREEQLYVLTQISEQAARMDAAYKRLLACGIVSTALSENAESASTLLRQVAETVDAVANDTFNAGPGTLKRTAETYVTCFSHLLSYLETLTVTLEKKLKQQSK